MTTLSKLLVLSERTEMQFMTLIDLVVFYTVNLLFTIICLCFLFHILSTENKDLAEKARREGFDEKVRF